jgi:hypothetical protein
MIPAILGLLRNAKIDMSQGWANFFVGGPNEKSKMSAGPT